MTGIFHCEAVQNCIKMPLITCPNVGCRKVCKYQMEEKRHLESKKCQELPPETSNSSKSIVKKDDGYLCLLKYVMLKLNIQTISGIKSYVKKIKTCSLPVMYATSNSNLNANWRGTCKFILHLFLFATSTQRVARGKTT